MPDLSNFPVSSVDKKDLQIMELLAQNCRIPHSVIASSLRLSKDAVTYRIRKLERDGFLEQRVLFVDARKLGFTRYHLLLRIDEQEEDVKDLCKKIAKHPYVMWVNSFIGRYDIQVIVDACDGFKLNDIKEELFSLCKGSVKEYTILTHLSDLAFTHLNPVLDLGTKVAKKNDHSFSGLLTTKSFPVKKKFERVGVDLLDLSLLKLLADDPTLSLSALGTKVGATRQTVKQHIVSLIKRGVILNFGGIPSLTKLGFVTYYLLVRLDQSTPHALLQKPFKKLNNIFYAGEMVGDYDLILYLNARNPQELNDSIGVFKEHLGKHILHYDLLIQDKVWHWRQFTSGIYGHMKELTR